uniref:Outer envelope protein 61 n=1 Tax=Oryza punctata TaxID=4537 RepID=A0A0E0LHE6_ORYPU
MMDPEMMRLAQEQMSKMSPADLARMQQQLLSNPNLVKLASESMKNMRADDFRRAAQQMNQTRPDEMLDMAEKLANANPEEVAAMKVQAEQQMSYVISGAKMLKQQGNELHRCEQYSEAAAKYKLAKDNLKNIPSQSAHSLQLVCTLNLMACYLKTRNFEECINEGSEVLTYDSSNVKAYYRRGQAYKELGNLEKKNLQWKGKERSVIIEEVVEDASEPSSSQRSSSPGYTVSQPPEGEGSSRPSGPSSIDANGLSKLGMQGMSPELVKTASDMIGTMKPEELQKMFEAASSLHGTSSSPPNLGPNMPEMSPEMFKMASDMIGNMSPDELQNMLNFASNMGGPSASPLRPEKKFQPSSRATTGSTFQRSVDNSQPSSSQNVMENPDEILSNQRMGESSSPGAPSTADMQETMRNAMKDPAMRKMYASMMKNISPEMMSSMSEQFGMKMTKEDAAKAQEALSSLSPEALDRMMKWMDRAQQGVEAAKKTKNWLLGRKGLVLAIVMLILAFILHQLGFIGG